MSPGDVATMRLGARAARPITGMIRIALVLALAGCDQTLLGERGLLEFTPDDCGARSCDLRDDIATDATLAIVLRTHNRRHSAPDTATLESGEPGALEVTGETGLFNPRFRLRSHGPGHVQLVAVARDNGVERIDLIDVEVVATDGIALDVSGAGEAEPLDDTTVRYRVPALGRIHIGARPTAGGRELTGVVSYTCAFTPGLATAPGCTTGSIDIHPPTGTHRITLELPGRVRRTIELVAD